MTNLAISTAAGYKEVSRQELWLEHIGLVSRVELEHFPRNSDLSTSLFKLLNDFAPNKSKKGVVQCSGCELNSHECLPKCKGLKGPTDNEGNWITRLLWLMKGSGKKENKSFGTQMKAVCNLNFWDSFVFWELVCLYNEQNFNLKPFFFWRALSFENLPGKEGWHLCTFPEMTFLHSP